MNIKIRISFKKRRFLALKPPFLADKTVLFNVKNHTFLREKAKNEACFCFVRLSKTWFYAMQA